MSGDKGPGLDRLPLVVAMAAAAFAMLAFPIWQAIQTGGFVYYLNGLDEYTYLQYDYSLAVQALSRPGQFLVTMGHQVGFSGGWLNVLFDAAALLGFPLLMRAIFRRLGWDARRADAGAIGMLLLPMLVTTANPLMTWLRNWNVESGALYWLNVPELYTPALARSPEPQFSLMLLAAVVLLGLRWRRFWPVYAAIPFMYPFVAVPAGFVTLACHLHTRWPLASARTAGPLVVAAIAISSATGLYNALLVPEKTRAFLLASRLPLISFTSVVALAALVLLWKRIEAPLRFPALALALAPLVACNMQLISGIVVHPDNYEQYLGCFVVALVLLFGLAEQVRLRQAIIVLAALVFLRSAYVTHRVNQAAHARLPLTPALVEALEADPDHVVVDDAHQASLLSLVLPRQGSTALAYERTYVALADRYVPRYRCLKAHVLAERPIDPALADTFKLLDHAYAYGSQDFPFAHLGRKREFKRLHDVSPLPCDDRAPIRYFPVAR